MKIYIFIFVILFFLVEPVFAQSNEIQSGEDSSPDEGAIMLLFIIAVIFVAGIGIYISREIILRKKTDYDTANLESKKNRDYEKYHSSWSEDGDDFESKKSKIIKEDFIHDSGSPNYYEMLGVATDATQDQIKNRYRSLAKELHPDKSKDKETQEKMAKINEAYEILSDEDSRKRYNEFLNLT